MYRVSGQKTIRFRDALLFPDFFIIYATFGADFYTFVTNNAADAASASHTVASNQIRIFNLMSKFFGYTLITLGGIGVCLFGCLCFSYKPVDPAGAAPTVTATSNINEHEAKEPEKGAELGSKTEDKPFVCEACGSTFTGWYQEYPNCHAVGKMKKNK